MTFAEIKASAEWLVKIGFMSRHEMDLYLLTAATVIAKENN